MSFDLLFKLLNNKLSAVLLSELRPFDVFIVGGCIRDIILENYKNIQNIKDIKDIDLVVFGCLDLENLVRKIANLENNSFVVLDKENKIYRVVSLEKNLQLDFSAPRGENIEEDLKARDFTINAIALNLQNKLLIDPLNGLDDLQNKIIRSISLKNLQDDPLRILRAFRFQVKLNGFTIEENTINQFREPFFAINSIATERISAEIWSFLEAENCFETLKQLRDLGIFELIFPEFIPQKKVPANDFHHLPLWEHTFELVNQYENFVKFLLPTNCLNFIKTNKINNISLEAIIKMACLLHDIAKPETWKIINNKHTFYNHDNLGAEITLEIGKRMHWPKEVTKSISLLVKYHLRPFHIAPINQEPTERAENRFFRKLNSNFYLLIALAWADLLSTRGINISQEIINNSQERLLKLCLNYEIFQKREENYQPLLAGEDLKQAINLSKLPQTKIIKNILLELKELHLENKINSKKQALEWFLTKSKQVISKGLH